MKKIILLAESGSDVSRDMAQRYHIYIVPMHITFDTVSRPDGTFSPEEIVRFYERTHILPKTSCSTPGDFADAFDTIHSEQPDAQMLYLAYSAATTSSYNNARIAAEGRDYVASVDTKFASAGQAAIVISMARLLEQHLEWDINAAVNAAQELVVRCRMCFIPEQLEFLRAGGRLTNAAAVVGTILDIHPLIEIKDGIFFEQAEGKESILIHCAGLVSVASAEDRIWSVNVDGTRNIVDLCGRYSIHKLLYVSSVHAIEEKERGQVICETKQFSASRVKGIYGKSKAEAAAYVQKASERGLHAMTVHPSGMIGPEDYSGGYMTETIKAFLKGYFPCAVEGGYDFVDVRDVADGIIKCTDRGKSGETYILSNEYITVKRMFDILGRVSGKRKVWGTVPLKAVQWVSPLCEKVEKAVGWPMLVTPYSTYTLGSNADFSHEKAERELGYSARPVEETLADIALWLRKER